MYILNAIELISSIWGYCYISLVSLTVPGRIGNFKLLWVLQPLFYVHMATIIQHRFINHQYFFVTYLVCNYAQMIIILTHVCACRYKL